MHPGWVVSHVLSKSSPEAQHSTRHAMWLAIDFTAQQSWVLVYHKNGRLVMHKRSIHDALPASDSTFSLRRV